MVGFSILNFLSKILVMVALVMEIAPAHAAVKSELEGQARNSIYHFFIVSRRAVQSIQIGQINKTSASGIDYLVEGEVLAQSPVDQDIVPYHCGVFIKRSRNKWVTQQTVCEALPEKKSEI